MRQEPGLGIPSRADPATLSAFFPRGCALIMFSAGEVGALLVQLLRLNAERSIGRLALLWYCIAPPHLRDPAYQSGVVVILETQPRLILYRVVHDAAITVIAVISGVSCHPVFCCVYDVYHLSSGCVMQAGGIFLKRQFVNGLVKFSHGLAE